MTQKPKKLINNFCFKGNLTPTVELNALAMKRGEPAVYLAEPTTIPPHPLNAPIINGHGVNSSQQQHQPPPQQHHHPVNPHQMQTGQQVGPSQQPNQFIPHQLNQYNNFHRNSNNSSNNNNNNNVYPRFHSNYERRGGMARTTYGKYDYQVGNG